ncbi:hypothetical protein A9Q84_00140 [Halobacteriovorax marinus]|uniref:Uncharacterized protein n=1 Tax=Halobacteriovorax marinus TaxID=97084 RepID=A0A1Y5FDE7_9BACT|nr:hypothetical protein A9Q84_00140 [Halobacteriovorax marinus]
MFNKDTDQENIQELESVIRTLLLCENMKFPFIESFFTMNKENIQYLAKNYSCKLTGKYVIENLELKISQIKTIGEWLPDELRQKLVSIPDENKLTEMTRIEEEIERLSENLIVTTPKKILNSVLITIVFYSIFIGSIIKFGALILPVYAIALAIIFSNKRIRRFFITFCRFTI